MVKSRVVMRDLTIEEIHKKLHAPEPKALKYNTMDLYKNDLNRQKLLREQKKLIEKWDKEIDKLVDELDRIDSEWRRKLAKSLKK